jgi:hypothetical protein
LCPRAFMNATVSLSYAYSKETWFGMSWSCRRGCALACGAVMFWSRTCTRLWIVAVIIREPPAAPVTKYSVPLANSTIVGDIDERGLFPGLTKLEGLGMYLQKCQNLYPSNQKTHEEGDKERWTTQHRF